MLDLNFSHEERMGISKYFEMSALEYLQHNSELEDLDERDLLHVSIVDSGHSYSCNSNVIKAILRNQEIIQSSKEDNPVSFVNEFYKILVRRGGDKNESLLEAQKFEKKNLHISFVKKIQTYISDEKCRFCLYLLCYYFLQDCTAGMQEIFINVYDYLYIDYVKLMLSGEHILYKKGFIDFINKGSINDSTITITDKTKEMFLGENLYLFEAELNEKTLISPDSILEKQLFYSKENQKQINTLYSSLCKDNLISIQSGLKKRGFPTGICILLYGAPGTGKTESVYQIAKATNRQIYHVDISQTKSCWFGESEKQIQKIFDDYKRMCEKVKLNNKNDYPILLFNEVDAIIQKRTEFRGGGAEKTENAMQNILLENLEKFDGIMIATTNLEINMDAAFERRFLYKIKFENPTLEAKTAIWQSKLNWLPEEQAKQLANEYNFSGGEIDNVVRKATMEEILNGSKVTMNRLEELCKSEKLINNNSSKKVGFCM